MTLGQRVRQRREEKGMSLSALARSSQVSKGYLSQIENDSAPRPSGETLYRMATALGTTVADLLGREVEVATIAVSPSLREFAREASLPEADVSMLAGIRYRGEQPRNSADWRYLYESIRRTIRGGSEPNEA
ncbi:MAG: helix-turn-helix transcriptional regulator [Anaerolineae bacterium]|jgi:transcriptional regulator with XRE-family HTH domain|nr:helix-turn-helix transcriptional regulator [Anaerolineae bacterium]